MRKLVLATLCVSVLAGCAAPPSERGPSVEHGFATAGTGLGHLVLSPFMIAAGLLEGLAALPYFLATGLHELNRGMVEADAKLTLEHTYAHAYGQRLEDVRDDGDTGVVFTDMRSATESFQGMLRQLGVRDANRYLLTAVRTADLQGYTLYAVVHRPAEVIEVRDKQDSRVVQRYAREDLRYYQPFVQDASGRPLDSVIDWAGVPRTDIRTQRAQAILMTLAANSIVSGKRTPDYWPVEQRWIDGQFQAIATERDQQLRARMGLSSPSQALVTR